ncbi:MAG: hypothetical protein R3A51_10120 [Nannocystaceae bacterium]
MSTPRQEIRLGLKVAAGVAVALVVGMYFWTGDDAARTPASVAGAAAVDAARPAPERAAGLRATPLLAAERRDRDDEAAPRRGAIEVEAPPRSDRERPDPPPEPPPPIELTPEQEAANDAHLALREEVTAAVERQLERQRRALARACWTDARIGDAASATFLVSASFEASGALASLGISDVRPEPGEAAAPDVGACLREQSIDLDAGALAEGVSVEVSLTLP